MQRKRILITGAGSGLGKGAAIRLATRGHSVIAGVLSDTQAQALKAEADLAGAQLRIEHLDVTSPAHRDAAGTWDIDVLICNAAVGQTGPLAEIPLQLVRDVFEVNVFGQLAMAQSVLKRMVQNRRGRIIFVSSIAGLSTTAFFGPYCASKHALEAIAEAMQDELRVFGITVAVINPGPINTGFNEQMFATWRSWYDENKNFTKKEHLGALAIYGDGKPLPGGMQSEQDEAVDLYVSLAEAEAGLFRNVVPRDVEEKVRVVQERAWTRKQ